jgi:SAM-dependent methyltransferase
MTDCRQRQRQQRHWDELALSLPDLFLARSTQYYRRCEMALIRRELGDLAGKRVLKLDLWNEALNTRILHWIDSQAHQVVGLDISHVVTRLAKRNSVSRGAPLRVLQADIRDLPLSSGSFDCAYAMGTIEHIREYEQALREIRRVLRPGGKAIIGVPHKWNIFLRPTLVKLLELAGKYPYAPEKSFSARELRTVIEGVGLKAHHRGGILVLPGGLRMLDLLLFSRRLPGGVVLSPLYRLCAYFETRWRWPGFFGYLLTMVAEKPASRKPRRSDHLHP